MHELKKIDEEVFLDRDGTTFQHLVNYLRNDREVLPEFSDRNDELMFFKELDFWKVPVKSHQQAQASEALKQQFKQEKKTAFHVTRGSAAQIQQVQSNSMMQERYQQSTQIRKTVQSTSMSLGGPKQMPAQLLQDDYEVSQDGDGDS